jgi:hypothetical protein
MNRRLGRHQGVTQFLQVVAVANVRIHDIPRRPLQDAIQQNDCVLDVLNGHDGISV